jgi:conjugative transfer signal peptidase TraF
MHVCYPIATRKRATAIPRSLGLIWGTWTLIAATGLMAYAAGFRVNTTPSMPLGVWRIEPHTAALHPGDVVTFCPPDTAVFRAATERGYVPRGGCASGVEPLLKPVVAVEGDVVTVTPDGVAVNGSPIPGSAPLVRDTAGRPLRPLPPGDYRLASGELWLLSTYTPRSWDSRYFGAVPAASIVGVARPVWLVP